MEKLNLKNSTLQREVNIELPSSKSESNRLLIAQAISKNAFKIQNLSEAEDTKLLQAALKSSQEIIDVGMAGTAFRFLTAFYAIQDGRKTILTGAERMKERPIGILVDALRTLGASIKYLEKEGYPPLEIQGKSLKGGKLFIDGAVSSQYISALLLIAPALKTPLQMEVTHLVSKPYVKLTIKLMTELNVKVSISGHNFLILPAKYHSKQAISVTADWSSAAFFYQLMSFSKLEKIHIKALKADGLQGDEKLVEIFQSFGVETKFTKDGAELIRKSPPLKRLTIDLSDCPDLIPSVAVASAVLMEECEIKGVSTLRIKESNRVAALKSELAKINVGLEEVGEDQIIIKGTKDLPKFAVFKSHNDHRMAMCLSPLIFLMDEVQIEDPDVVHKSFPYFWEQLTACGVSAVRT